MCEPEVLMCVKHAEFWGMKKDGRGKGERRSERGEEEGSVEARRTSVILPKQQVEGHFEQ